MTMLMQHGPLSWPLSKEIAVRPGFEGLTDPLPIPPPTPWLDWDAASMTLPTSWAYTRASTGTYFDINGVMQTAAANAPRFTYDPVTREFLGLLMEEASTNLLLNSATLVTQSVTTTAVIHTLSFYGSGSVVLSGTHAATVSASATGPRTTYVFTPTAGSLTLTVTGTVTNAQLEAINGATSYIATTGTTVTRARDLCERTVLTLIPHTLSAMVQFRAAKEGATLYAIGAALWIAPASVLNDSLRVVGAAGNINWQVSRRNNATDDILLTKASTSSAGANITAAFAIGSDSGYAAFNGDAMVLDNTLNTLAWANIGILRLGTGHNVGSGANVTIRRCKYWDGVKLSQAQVQTLARGVWRHFTRPAIGTSIPTADLSIPTSGKSTVLWSGVLNAVPGTATQTITMVDNNASSGVYLRNIGGTSQIQATRTGPVTAVNMGAAYGGIPFKAGMSVPGDGSAHGSLNGMATAVVPPGGPTSGMTNFRFGAGVGAGSPIVGSMSYVRVLPDVALSDAELATLVNSFETTYVGPTNGTNVSLASLGVAPNGACTILMGCNVTNTVGVTQYAAMFSDDTVNNQIYFRITSGGGFSAGRTTAGSAAATAALGTPVNNVEFRGGLVVYGDGLVRASMNGGAVLSVGSAPTTGLKTLTLGANIGGGNALVGSILKLRIFPGLAVSDGELQTLTQNFGSTLVIPSPAVGTIIPTSAMGIPASGKSTIVWTGVLASVGSAYQALYMVDDGSASNLFGSRGFVSSPALQFMRSTGGASTTGAYVGNTASGVPFRAAAAIMGDGTMRGSLNGGAIGTVTGGPTSGLTTLRVGQYSTGTLGILPGGMTHQVQVIPNVAYSDAQLQALSAPLPTYLNPAIGSSWTLASLGVPPNGMCTVLVKATITALGTGGVQAIVMLDDNTTATQIFIRHPSTGTGLAIGRLYQGSFYGPSAGTLTANTEFKCGMALNGDGTVRGVMIGGTFTTAAGGPAFGLTHLRVGNAVSGATLGGSIGKLVVYPGIAMTDTEMQLALGMMDQSYVAPAIGTAIPLATLGVPASGKSTILYSGNVSSLAAAQAAVHVDDNTNSNRFYLGVASTSGNIQVSRATAGSGASSASLGSTVVNVPHRAGMVILGDGTARGSMNGGTVQSVGGGPSTGLTHLHLGNNAVGTGALTNPPSRVQVFPGVVMSDAELQAAVLNFDPVILTSPAISTNVTLASMGIDPSGKCTVLVVGTLTTLGAGLSQFLVSINDGTAGYDYGIRNPASGVGAQSLRKVNGVSATGAIGNFTANVPAKVGMVIPGDGTLRASFAGAAAITISGGVTAGLTQLTVGGEASGTSVVTGGGSIARVVIYPNLVMTDSELQAAVLALP